MRSLCVVLLLALPGAADQLVLAGGGRISGEIEHEGEQSVTIRLPSGSMTVPRDRIESIVREDRGAYLRREATSRLAQGSTASAVDLCERAYSKDPAAAPALHRALAEHAAASIERFRLDLAKRAVARLAELEPGHDALAPLRRRLFREEATAASLHDRAERARAGGRFREAIDALHAWSLRKPADDRAAARELARVHREAGAAALADARLRLALDHFRAAQSYGARGDVLRELERLLPVAAIESLRAGRDEEARRAIESVRKRCRTPGVARFLEAVRHQLQGEVREAVAAYEEAGRQSAGEAGPAGALPFDVVVRHARTSLRRAVSRPPPGGAERWAARFTEPLVARTEGRVTAHAPTAELATRVAKEAASSLRDAADRIGAVLPDSLRAQVVIHRDRETYLAADRNPGDAPLAGVEITREPTAGVTYATVDAESRPLLRVESFAGQPSLLEAIVPHEMMHVAQHAGFPAFRRAHWLDEGLAMLQESESVRAQRVAWLRRGPAPLPLREFTELRTTPEGKEFLFYNQACALTEYLRSRGSARDWRAFLERLAGRDFAEALRQTYGIESVEILERDFLASAGLSG